MWKLFHRLYGMGYNWHYILQTNARTSASKRHTRIGLDPLVLIVPFGLCLVEVVVHARLGEGERDCLPGCCREQEGLPIEVETLIPRVHDGVRNGIVILPGHE